MFEGLLGIGIGVTTFFAPGLTAVGLLFYIAAWSLATGILEIVGVISLRKEIQGEVRWIFSGVCLNPVRRPPDLDRGSRSRALPGADSARDEHLRPAFVAP